MEPAWNAGEEGLRGWNSQPRGLEGLLRQGSAMEPAACRLLFQQGRHRAQVKPVCRQSAPAQPRLQRLQPPGA